MKKKKRGSVRAKKNGNFNLKKEYALAFDYIMESRRFIYSVIWIFLLFFLIGFLFPTPEVIELEILEFIKDLIGKIEGMSQFELIRFIFLNNLQSSFFGMIFGAFLGIFPIIAVIVNGYLLGFVALMSVQEAGFSILWRLFPHGIFELPAVFISLGLGVKIGTFIFKRNKSESFKDYLWNSMRVFLFIVLPLLIIAAVIEGILISLEA